MDIQDLDIKGLYLLTPKIFEDKRGYFTEVFKSSVLAQKNIDIEIKQINRSKSTQIGVIRGLHYQVGEYAQTKIIQCIRGRIFDVAVDLRKDSSTFGKWLSFELSEANHKLLYIPKGFAHGLQVLEEDTVIEYFMDSQYSPEMEGGVVYSDNTLNINWPITKNIIVSEKDRILPQLDQRRLS